jgi:hypothetical protein
VNGQVSGPGVSGPVFQVQVAVSGCNLPYTGRIRRTSTLVE